MCLGYFVIFVSLVLCSQRYIPQVILPIPTSLEHHFVIFAITRSVSVRITVQPSSHNGHNATSDVLCNAGSICVFLDCTEMLECSGRSPLPSVLIVVPSGWVTSEPSLVLTLLRTHAYSGHM